MFTKIKLFKSIAVALTFIVLISSMSTGQLPVYASGDNTREIVPVPIEPGGGTVMTKDVIYSGTLSAGSTHYFFFTPSYSGLFTVETFGTTDTYGTVSGNVGTSLTDDDSGELTNFAIGFYQTEGNTTIITVRHCFSAGTGSYTIQVRDQRAQIYTFNYGSGNIDTTPDSVTPSEKLLSMGYAVGVHENKPKSHVDQTIATTFKRFNSEVIFFAGHGGSGGGSLVFMNSSGGYDWFYDNSAEFSSMSNTKVAVWAACYSGLDPDGTGTRKSIAQKSIDQGAQSAIGWDQAIGNTAARKWTNKFFTELANAKTVSQAASSAGSVFLWPWDGSYSGWQVFGDGTTMVSYPNVNPKSGGSSIQNGFIDATKEDFVDLITNYDYSSYELKNLGTRYYKTINGNLTNVFVDVYNDGTYKKSTENISLEEITNAESIMYSENTFCPQKSVYSNGILFDRLVSSEEHIIHFKQDGSIIPIKMIFTEYESNDGIAYQDVTCINLYTNEFINYENICTIY